MRTERDTRHRTAAAVANKPGEYGFDRPFTGIIKIGETKGRVTKARFKIYEYGGVWFYGGTWEGGTMWDGTFKGGTWKKGTWKGNGSTWIDGTWENGTWEGGNWVTGTWKKGKWKKGTWDGGKWIDGTWEDGDFYGGNWYGGTWLTGKFKGGNWHGGTWKDGEFIDGWWRDGIWEKGTFGEYSPVIWTSGVWKGGDWYGEKWKSGTWRRGTWHRGEWVIGFNSTTGRKVKTDKNPVEYKKIVDSRPKRKSPVTDAKRKAIQKLVNDDDAFLKKFGIDDCKYTTNGYGGEGNDVTQLWTIQEDIFFMPLVRAAVERNKILDLSKIKVIKKEKFEKYNNGIEYEGTGCQVKIGKDIISFGF